MNNNPLHILMNPKSISTVGAGNNPMKMGTMHAITITNCGYKGKFYPVHLKEETVLGHKAYKSVHDLPEAPDLAILIVPTDQVIQLLEDYGKIGTKRAIIISAGFKETGRDGQKMEDRLNEISEEYGIRFVGPNCIGIINTGISLNATVMTLGNNPGGLGLLSQSGTYVTQTQLYLKKRGIRYSKAISLGNEANISIVDALEYLGEDEDTKAIAMYIEGIRDGRRFIEVAKRITPHKPVIAQYVGGSDAGARSSLSHTGAMSGPGYLYEGVFKQAGIIQAHSVEDLYSHGWALATQPLIKGNRLAVVTNSGGPGTAISNTSNLGGMEVPKFSENLQKELIKVIPPHAPCGNPVDLTFHMDTSVLTTKIPELIMKSGEIDGMILHGAMGSGWMKAVYPNIRGILKGISLEKLLDMTKVDLTEAVALPWRHNIPLLISSFLDRDDECTEIYEDNNIPVFDAPEKAARGMLSLLKYRTIKNRKSMVLYELPEVRKDAVEILEGAIKRGQKALDEYQAKRILSTYGVPVTREVLVNSEEDAVSSAKDIGYPVVLKACSSEILHKTGRGLIYLNITDELMVAESYNRIKESAGKSVPILVQEMITGNREFVVGMTRFPSFGPAILFGLGGIYTEILKDSTIRVAPLSIDEADEMIFDINAKEILGEFRGSSPVDVDSLACIIQSVSFISVLHPEISEIDLNPVMISGSKPVVADALFVLNN